MKRRLFAAGIALSTLASAGAVQADWNEFWHRVHVDWHRNNSWPEPFPHPERASVRTPFALMAAKGWQLNCTLSDYDFDAERNVLNRSGVAKIDAILKTPSQDRRAIYVVMGKDKAATAVRVDSVQKEIAGLIVEGPMPPVMVTDLRPQTTPAEDVAGVMQAYQSSRPAPVLPAASGGSSGSSGGSGGGGSTP